MLNAKSAKIFQVPIYRQVPPATRGTLNNYVMLRVHRLDILSSSICGEKVVHSTVYLCSQSNYELVTIALERAHVYQNPTLRTTFAKRRHDVSNYIFPGIVW